MIIVDPKGPEKLDGTSSAEKLMGHIRRLGVASELGHLQFGDFAFEGNGPDGLMLVGIERKTLHDMLNCIDDAHYGGVQKIGMRQHYKVNFLMMEGHWKPHDPEGWLMEGFNGGGSWGLCRYRSRQTLYSKLFRYLLSVQLSGTIVIPSRDMVHTAFNAVNMYEYFQKRWDDHTSLLQVPKLHIPDFNTHPSLVRKWASCIDDLGVKYSAIAEQMFKTPHALANSDERSWLSIRGIGVKTARHIFNQIRGLKE